MRELVNLITIQQGANWKFEVSLLDDEVYKLRYSAFLDTYKDLVGVNNYKALTALVNANIEQYLLSLVTEDLLIDILTDEMKVELLDIFEEIQAIDLIGKQVKIYLQIFKSATANKTMKFDYLGIVGTAGKVSFNIPAQETQTMIHKLNRDYDERLLGFYTIELQDESTKEVMRILEGDLEISRGAKNVCEFQGSAETNNSVV